MMWGCAKNPLRGSLESGSCCSTVLYSYSPVVGIQWTFISSYTNTEKESALTGTSGKACVLDPEKHGP